MTASSSSSTAAPASEGPRIYVRCLAAYNNAILHGAWIDAAQDADAIQDDVNAMLAASPEQPAEEWAIHDFEGFGSYHLSEWTGFPEVAAIAALIVEHGVIAAEVLVHYAGDIDEARTALEERYAGVHRSLADFVADLTCETAPPPEHLANYIDWDAMARDMELNGDVFTVETGDEEVHVFWSR
jgi:antirestriction protein